MEFKITSEFTFFQQASRQGFLTANYHDLVAILGEPVDTGVDFVTGEWLLTDSNGNLVCIYDWKMTDLYDESYPSADEFREQKYAEFCVGGFSEQDAINLHQWLKPQLTGKIYGFVPESEYQLRLSNCLPLHGRLVTAKI